MSAIETKPLVVEDFSGGETDYYIDGVVTQAQTLDNLMLNVNKKPRTRPGGQLFGPGQLPLGVFRVNHQIFYDYTEFFAFQNKRAYHIVSSAWAEQHGPGTNTFFPEGATDMAISGSPWRGHYFLTNDTPGTPQKLYRDNSGNYQTRNAGLPDVPAGASVTAAPGAGHTYLYAFVLRSEYYVEQVLFVDLSKPQYYPTQVVGGVIAPGNAASITLPTTLSTPENWDTSNFKVEIYRTQDAGNAYFLVATVSFGTASYSDTTVDASLVQTLYANGGIATRDTPPKCKYLHVVNDIGYYASCVETTGGLNEYLILQSVPGDPDSVPAAFNCKTEQKISGFNSIFDRPMAFCSQGYVYRIDGVIAEDQTGNAVPVRINDSAGCVSNNSIVQTPSGIFWAGINGFYWSDGFTVKMISTNYNKVTYKNWVSTDTRKKHIKGAYDTNENRVYWTVCNSDSSGEPDGFVVIDLKCGLRDDGGATYTRWSGTKTSFRPTSLLIKDKVIYRGDTRGYIVAHKDGVFTDPDINPDLDPSLWNQLTVVHTYKSCFLDFGTKFLRKLVPRILISAENVTNLSLAISSSNDNNRVKGDLKPIRYRANIVWGDSLPLWGDPEALWNAQGLIEEWRRFPAGGLRCNYKQVIFTNALVQIFNSDLLGSVVVNATTKTATLMGSFQWIPDMLDYYISFETSNYTVPLMITNRTLTTLTFSDANNTAIDGTTKFIVTGLPKGEVMELNGYIVHWSLLSKSHKPFSSASLGSTPV